MFELTLPYRIGDIVGEGHNNYIITDIDGDNFSCIHIRTNYEYTGCNNDEMVIRYKEYNGGCLN